MALTFTACIVVLLARGLYLRLRLAGHQLLGIRRMGPMRLELRRHAHLAACRDGMGETAFPQPKEERTLVLCIAGLPVWRGVQCIGLPRHVQDVVDQVGADDFDAGFSSAFRVTRPALAPDSPTGRPPATGAA